MKRITAMICLGGFLSLGIAAIASADCTVADTPERDAAGQARYIVFDSSDSPVGYVQEGTDGLWSVWVAGKGALNVSFEAQGQAAEALCREAEKP